MHLIYPCILSHMYLAIFPAILVSGIDFLLATSLRTGRFESGESRTCTNVTILPDDRVEDTENFTVTLTGSNSVVVSNSASNAIVFIDDDDGELVYNHECILIGTVIAVIQYVICSFV